MTIIKIKLSHYDADYEDFGAHFPGSGEDTLHSIPAVAKDLLLGIRVKC